MVGDLPEPFANRRLMGQTRCGHGVSLAFDQFPPFVVGPATVVGVSNSTLSEHLSLFVKLLFAIGGIDGGLPFSVAHLHLAEDLRQSRIPSGEEVIQQRSNIGTA